jgi:hypothetical protein
MAPVIGIGARKKEYPVPTNNARKIAAIIADGIRLQEQLAQIKAEIEKNSQLLIPHAEHLSGLSDQKTVMFRSEDGQATVKFGDQLIYSEKEVAKAEKILGPLFDQAFSRETSFAVSILDIPEIEKKLGKDFDRLVKKQTTHKHKPKLRELLADGDSQIGMKLREVIVIEATKPSVKFEKITG